jgi:hypothetical protein
MFIKILTPNHNGKIELTVRDLEALIQEAVDKAVREKCAGCVRGCYGGITYLNGTQLNHTEPSIDWSKVTCGNSNDTITLNGGLTVCEASNEVGVTTQASTLTSKINALINQGEK